MWKVDKVEQYKGNFGYVYLTRLNDEGEELSEKLMLPIMVLDGYDWKIRLIRSRTKQLEYFSMTLSKH